MGSALYDYPKYVRFTDLDESPAQAVKNGPANLLGYSLLNPNGYAVYVKFYNILAASVTVGTSAIALTVLVPATSTLVVRTDVPQQIFTTALSVAATKLVADNDTTSLDSDVIANIYYT